MRYRPIVVTALFLLICGFTPLAKADILTLRDGSTIEGEILSETRTKVVIKTKIANIKTTKTIARRQIKEVSYQSLADDFWGIPKKPTPDPATTAPDNSEGEALDTDEPETRPPQRTHIQDNVERTHFAVVPIHGTIGVEVNAYGLRKALTAVKKRRIEHVVFTIDSPGGYVYQALEMMEILKEFDDALIYHAVIEEGAISAASIFAACSDDIFVRPGSRLGGAVAFSEDSSTGNATVDAKMNSIWASEIASRAEAKGHHGEVFRAMAVLDVQLFQAPDGSISTTSSAGAEQIDTASTILTIRAAQMVKAGIATELTGELDDLGEIFGIKNFAEHKNVASKIMKQNADVYTKLEARREKAIDVLNDAGESFENNDPLQQDDYTIVRRRNRNNSLVYSFDGDSSQKWNRRTQDAIKDCETMRSALKELAAVSKAAKKYEATHMIIDENEGDDTYTNVIRTIQRLRDQYGSPPWSRLIG